MGGSKEHKKTPAEMEPEQLVSAFSVAVRAHERGSGGTNSRRAKELREELVRRLERVGAASCGAVRLGGAEQISEHVYGVKLRCSSCKRLLVEQIGLDERPGNWDGVTNRCEFCKAADYIERLHAAELQMRGHSTQEEWPEKPSYKAFRGQRCFVCEHDGVLNCMQHNPDPALKK